MISGLLLVSGLVLLIGLGTLLLVSLVCKIILGHKVKLPKREIVREEHYGEEVWVSRLGEVLRKDGCLCLQCAKMKPVPDNCPYAQGFYENCKRGNIALMVTRCRDWQPKEEKK